MKILGTGSALPEKVVTNDDLARVMDTSDEWIRTRTGIQKRHIAVNETTTSMAVEAAKKALDEAKISINDLDLIIAATVSPDSRHWHVKYRQRSVLRTRLLSIWVRDAPGFCLHLRQRMLILKREDIKMH